MSDGQYVHFGLHAGLLRALDEWHRLNVVQTMEVSFNIDGLPLFKSSNLQVWPILAQAHHPSNKHFDVVFPVGIFCGTSKPPCLQEYLDKFVQELAEVLSCGLCYKGADCQVTLRAFLCDAPAKAYVKAAKSFSGYYGCDKCCNKGKYLGRMTFPNLHARLRTDRSFANQDQKKHHKGISPLTRVGIPMVTSFPLDYMHLVCLGVVRKLIGYWCKGPLKTRLAYFLIMQASGHLATFRSHIPRDFARKPRALHLYERWKATEFRHFVLYSGPVALKKVLPLGKYRHFLHLHVAIVILSCPSMESFYPYAHHLFGLLCSSANQSMVSSH